MDFVFYILDGIKEFMNIKLLFFLMLIEYLFVYYFYLSWLKMIFDGGLNVDV